MLYFPTPALLQLEPVWRTSRKLGSERAQIKRVFSFEGCFANLMLFAMVKGAQADGPAIRRPKRSSAIGAAADMRALNGPSTALRH